MYHYHIPGVINIKGKMVLTNPDRNFKNTLKLKKINHITLVR